MWVNLILKAVLFTLLVPGVVVRLPADGSLLQQALVHGLIFAVVNWYVYMYVRPALEYFKNPDTRELPACPEGSIRCGKDCKLKGEGPCMDS